MAFTTQYVPVLDGGVPRTITGRAREAISGGQFVFASGAANVVNVSGLQSFVTSDILYAVSASGAQFNGIALANAGSNESLTIATRGLFIVGAENTVTAGFPVLTGGADGVLNYTLALGSVGNHPIGRAVTSAGSEGYCLVELGY